MQPVRVGVIGLGRFGALHAKVWAQLPHVELVGLTLDPPVRLLVPRFRPFLRHVPQLVQVDPAAQDRYLETFIL